jgi:hypothetical protein
MTDCVLMINRSGSGEAFLIPESELSKYFVPTQDNQHVFRFSSKEDPDNLRQYSTVHTLGWPKGKLLEPSVQMTRILFFFESWM